MTLAATFRPISSPMFRASRSLPLLLPALLGVSLRARADGQTPAVPFQVLQQQTVDAGTHRITFNRVAPPPPQPTPAPSAKTPGAAPNVNSPDPAAATSTTGDGADLRALLIGATVYDGRFTELRGADTQGAWRAWSNVDFNLLASVGEFGTTTATYSLYLSLGSDTLASLTQTGRYPSNLASLPSSRAGYSFADGATAAGHPEAAAALDALHRFHDAYRPQLLQALQRRQADQAAHAAQAEQERLHPTPPPDTVIHFWPKQGSSFLGR